MTAGSVREPLERVLEVLDSWGPIRERRACMCGHEYVAHMTDLEVIRELRATGVKPPLCAEHGCDCIGFLERPAHMLPGETL